MREIEFYQAHLDRVSRSFAFCIRELKLPLRAWVSLSYLLCRALDTIEDAPWSSTASQIESYSLFTSFLNGAPDRRDVTAWAAGLPEGIAPGERLLAADAHLLFSDLRTMPQTPRTLIRETVTRMSLGMRHYSETSNGVLRLGDLREVNRYCYFVAGVIGELLTRLLFCARDAIVVDDDQLRALLRNAYHFGLFLQKVNLLKDQETDEAEGRFLVPDRRRVLSSTRVDARAALLYLTALPLAEEEYRRFCAWSLFLGLETLRRSGGPKQQRRIPRPEAAALFEAIGAMARDNAALLALGETFLRSLPDGQAADHSWFHRISGDVLLREDLVELGVCEESGEDPCPAEAESR